MLLLCGIHTDKNRLIQLKQSSGVQPDLIKRDYNRTSSVTEMLQSLDLDLLEDRLKAHRLNIFHSAINNSIALPIPNYFLPKKRFTRLFSNDSFIYANCNHDYYFYSFFPRTIRDWNSLPSGIRTSTNFALYKNHCFSAVRND